MENSFKERKKKKLSIGEIVLIVIFVLLFTGFISYLVYISVVYGFERNYYKEQMLGFCEISKLQRELILKLNPNLPIVDIGDCNHFILGNG